MTVCVDGDTGMGIAIVAGRLVGIAMGVPVVTGIDSGGGCITSSSSSMGEVNVGRKGAFTSA